MKVCGDSHAALAHHGTVCPACEQRAERCVAQERADRLHAELMPILVALREALVALMRAAGPELTEAARREALDE